jgi:hypothetical protein
MHMPKLHRQVLVFVLVGSVCNILHASPLSASTPQQASPQKGSATTPAQNAPPDDKLSLSDQLLQDVFEPLRAGMESQNIRQILSAFDKREMSDYGDLEQQLHAFFRQYDQVRFRYQLLQAAMEDTPDKDLATATAEMDMDAMPFSVTQIAVRRSVQMHFQLKHEPKGWRVTSFSPSDFFNVDYSSK